MTTRAFRFGIGAGGLALFMALGTGCGELIDFNDRELQQPPTRPQEQQEQRPEEMPVRTCTAVVSEVTPEYEAMCRHYCSELDETVRYYGLASGATREPAPSAPTCYELRCAPRCVTVETCTQQCHALGVQYQAVCAGVEVAPDTVCPVSIDERVNACLAGCGVAVPPPTPEDPPPPPEDRPPDVIAEP